MNRIELRVMFVVLAVAVGLLTAFHGSQAANKPAAPVLMERNEALNRLTGLGEQERELAAELLDWHIKIETARQEQERLNREIPVVRQVLADSEADLLVTRKQLSVSQGKLGRWVNFLYRDGPATYLEVILGSVDFNDFIARAESVRLIITNQIRLLNEVRDLQSCQEAKVEVQRQAQADLTFKTAALSQKIADMERDQAGREAFLAEIRQQSTELSEQVIQYETAMYQSITPVRYLVTHLDALPWDSLSPEKVSLNRRGLELEYTDQEVNRVFFAQGDPGLASFSVQFSRGLFSISSCGDTAGTDFRIEGNFVLDGAGKVRYQPERAFLGGLPVSSEVLKYIASEQGMSVDLGDRAQSYRLTEIRAEEGKIVVTLATG